MTKLQTLIPLIQTTNHTSKLDPAKVEISGAYVSDLLSDVMGSASSGQVWVTIMRHLNVVAVASMTGIPAVIFAKGVVPEADVIEKATEEGILLLSSPMETFNVSGIIYQTLNG